VRGSIMSRSFERYRLRTRTHGVNPPERGRRGRRGGRCVLFLSTTRCQVRFMKSTICAAAGDAADSHPAYALIGYDRLTKGACQNERGLPKRKELAKGAGGGLPSVTRMSEYIHVPRQQAHLD